MWCLNNTNHKKYNQGGFTYIELILVIAIFSLISVIIGTMFILFTRAQSKTSVREKLVADGRYVMETLVRAARNNRIDYDAYPIPVPQPITRLSLRDHDGNPIIFELTNDACPLAIEQCLTVQNAEGVGFVSGSGLVVDYLNFYISPNVDPFAVSDEDDFFSNSQPQVTISLGISALQNTPDGRVSMNLQTTVSSKYYVR